ncbi:MAG: dienelactone hydrolase family protein [Betaproteobacteria bacterium]
MRVTFAGAVACIAVALAGCAGTGVTYPNLAMNDVKTAQGTVVVPEGKGPFPAVVILHGCGGIRPNAQHWAGLLRKHGYASIIVDAFTPRGISEICTNLGRIPAYARVLDGYAALRYLGTRPDIAADRVAVMGFSNGAVATLGAASDFWQDRMSETSLRFRAAVALYPECLLFLNSSFPVPTTILIGDKDDWTLSSSCEKLVAGLPKTSHPVTLKIYPGAHHAFDDLTSNAYLPQAMNRNSPTRRGASVYGHGPSLAKAERDALEFLGRHLALQPQASGAPSNK